MRNTLNNLKRTFGTMFGSALDKFRKASPAKDTAIPNDAPSIYKMSRADHHAMLKSLRKRCTRNSKFHMKRYAGLSNPRANHAAANDKSVLWPIIQYHLRNTGLNK